MGEISLDDPLLSSDTVAKMFDVTGYTMREWCKAGKIKGRKVNGRWKIQRSDAQALANEMYGEKK